MTSVPKNGTPWEGAKPYLLTVAIKEYPEVVAEIMVENPVFQNEFIRLLRAKETEAKSAETEPRKRVRAPKTTN
jgi:hypothetical protein